MLSYFFVKYPEKVCLLIREIWMCSWFSIKIWRHNWDEIVVNDKFMFRLYFINGQDKMLMDTKFNLTKPTAYVSGCDPRKQRYFSKYFEIFEYWALISHLLFRIIVRQSPYVDPFNWGSYLWMSNMRALGSFQKDDTIICSLRYFPAGQGSLVFTFSHLANH